MDPQQQPPAQPLVKKVLVKRVKVLVKRPVSAPPTAAAVKQPVSAPSVVKRPVSPATVQVVKQPVPTAGTVKQPVMVKVPVKRPVQQNIQPEVPVQASAAPVATPVPDNQGTFKAAPPTPSYPDLDDFDEEDRYVGPAPSRSSFSHRVNAATQGRQIVFTLPDDILESLERYEKVTDKVFLLYIYTRVYAQQVAQEQGYLFPEMMVELPENTSQIEEFAEEIDNDLFMAMLDDFTEMAPFISGMERVMAAKAPLEQVIQSELNRIQDQETLSTAQQILIAYLTVLVDMQIIHEKMNILDTQNESDEIINDIREMEEEEREMKESFITAIERKNFPVDARKLINNYFTLAKKDPDKAYDTLITNPLFFSPIQMERMPKKFFGLVKPSPKDAIAVNKRLASFLKNLKA